MVRIEIPDPEEDLVVSYEYWKPVLWPWSGVQGLQEEEDFKQNLCLKHIKYKI